MCGLAGLFLPNDTPIKEPDMDAMLAAMRHRGPDGEGRYESDHRRYRAGFRRLAIIDLETGDQPLIDDRTGRVLIGNGEIYNDPELRRRYAGYPYKTGSDMESVLAAHAARGDDFIHDLNGMYGLALYERGDHRLTLVRDRLGVKPLYWCEPAGGGILFASEIKPLFASGLINAEIDESVIGQYMAHGYVPAPATLYKGVRQLAPGHVLRMQRDGALSLDRYWRAEPAADIPAAKEDIIKHLTDLLGDSIALQLRSDVPLGVLLSGGIDSGLMVALAAGHASRPLNTFTVRFDGAPIDESPLAALVAERYGTHHTVLDLPATSVGDLMPLLAWHADEPLADPALLPNYLIEQALGKDLRVALNGTGGDELFAGYGRYFQRPIERRYLGLPGWLRRGLVEPVIGVVSPMTAWRLGRAEKFSTDPGGYLHDHTTLLPPPILKLLECPLPAVHPEQARFADDYSGGGQSALLYGDLNTYLPFDLLNLLDRTTMAAGVEGRVPFLDHRLVEAALAVPPEIRTPGGRAKGLERDMAAPYLPEQLLNAPKQGFASPVPKWMQQGLGEQARRLLTRKESVDRGWWSKRGVERLLAEPARYGFQIYQLLMLELCVRIHVESAPQASAPGVGLEQFL